MKCLACKKNQLSKFLDFKSIPLVNGFSSSLKKSNKTFKLQVMICKSCFVCQLKDTPSEKKYLKNILTLAALLKIISIILKN